MKASTRQSNRMIFWCFIIITCFLSLPHGGDRLWEYLPFAMTVFFLLALVFLSSEVQSDLHRLKRLKLPSFLLVVWLLYGFFQVIPLPVSWVEILNPAKLELKSDTGWGEYTALSIAPNLSLIEMMKFASYGAFFLLGCLLLNTKKRCLQATNAIFFTSVIIAIYSLINYYTDGAFAINQSIPPWNKPWNDVTKGTFSYQNHYACFLNITIPLGFGLFYNVVKQQTEQAVLPSLFNKKPDILMSRRALYLLGSLFIIFSLLKTGSRGGFLVFLFILLLFSSVIFLQNRKNSLKLTKKKALMMPVIVIIFFMVFIAAGLAETLSKRLEEQGFSANGRDYMHNTALSIITDYPIFGSGSGTYVVLQQQYKQPQLSNSAMSKRAHNDYLELLCNQGVVGVLILGSAVLLLYFQAIKKIIKNRKSMTNGNTTIVAAFIISIAGTLLHSLIDFNFQLPVITVWFYLILALSINYPSSSS